MGGATTRAHIVEAADQLFYRQGYENTSFAAIAEAVHISRGNFYYHFKSKDDILDAVIAVRLDGTRRMLEQWEAEEADPADRIRRFVEIVVTNRADIQSYGCPVGTLTTELAKLGHPALGEANGLFTLFRAWLREQFTQLGHETEADALAMHVLAFSQGVATLAHAFGDEDFIRREVQRMHDWLSQYSAGARRTTHAASEDTASANA
ncbi:TetR/AcrR family transcriptional regulator [Planomonospora sp. ID67723]|uniref:TetR/AcrR family transcriptional regulator n=1 Tax=Planomonospora sp. ID67723 TaxID=2738134 RepID=UPI0018C4199F|nr:TetR/AcrR family transcriptional regulator [Planomonospora sp. ID67723]MBG0833109.1 TetR/AcrR family transcriptional regulator [Planomonospora sp. ID67723]